MKNKKLPVKKSSAKKAVPKASVFNPMTSHDLIDVLGATIRKDDENKLIAFLAELCAYTESSQLNISFNAPSSSGKSYIPTEIAKLFPEEDVIQLAYCSPTAFFHDRAQGYDKETNTLNVDLSRKILIFLDQPHNLLMHHLRPLLSHDKKEMLLKITDTGQKGGLRTKNVLLRGFPTVIFCSANLKLDEQEATRFILLSPETNSEKIRAGVMAKIERDTDGAAYRKRLDDDPRRKLLKARIAAIKAAHIDDVNIPSPEVVMKRFFAGTKRLKPRHQRDIGRILSFIKAFALLNLWHRRRNGAVLMADETDINEAFALWEAIAESQELNLPPYVYAIYKEVLSQLWKADADGGLNEPLGKSMREITAAFFETYGRPLQEWMWQQMIAPMLESAGLIYRERGEKDKRVWLYYPTAPLSVFTDKPINVEQSEVRPPLDDDFAPPTPENNSEQDGGVEQGDEIDVEKLF